MLSLVPERLTRLDQSTRDCGLIALTSPSDGFELSVRRRERIDLIGRFPATDEGLAELSRRIDAAGLPPGLHFVIPADRALVKPLSMPAAVRRDLEQALSHEMDGEIPFSAEEVYWDWRLLPPDRTQRPDRIAVRLLAVPKSWFDPLLARLRQARIQPSALLIESHGGDRDLVRLDHRAGMEKSAPWRRPAVAWAGVGMLAVTAILMPFIRQTLLERDIAARIAAVQPAADEAQRLLSARNGVAGGGDAIAALRQRFGNPLEALAAVTDALPDDSFLSDFVLRDRKFTLSGKSAMANRLIGTLAAAPALADPAFAAPVTRLGSEGGNRELFSITAELRRGS